MHPLLTFVTGLVAGAAGVSVLKKAKVADHALAASGGGLEAARHGLSAAESGLRRATVSGLEALEKSSAALRSKLTPAEASAPESKAQPETAPADKGGVKPTRRRASAKASGKRSRRQAAEAPQPTPPEKDQPS